MSNIYGYSNRPLKPKHTRLQTFLLWFAVILVGVIIYDGVIRPAFAAEPIIGVAPSQIEVGFSPDQNASERIIRLIDGAKKEIRVAAYSFTSASIAKALLAAHKRGVDVRVVLDKSQRTARYSSYTFLTNVGIDTRINSRYAIQHNKYIIVDQTHVETGSFNFTKAAEERNAENLLIIRESPQLAQAYLQNWQKLWNESYLPQQIKGRQ